MQLTLTIPDELVERLLGAQNADPERAALERLALDGYQTGRLSAFQVRKLLGFETRIETQNWLGSQGAHENYTLDDLEADRRTLDRLFPS